MELMEVDLADLDSVHRPCDLMDAHRIRIDIALMNAGPMPPMLLILIDRAHSRATG